jgi:hypothetical protein
VASIALLPKLKTLSLKRNALGTGPQHQQALAAELFTDTAVVVLNLEGNHFTKAQLLDMQGVSTYMERRQSAKDKNLAGGALLDLSLCGLD